ncbi:AMP-binding protein [Streptomyces sp. NBC_00820]|uniref:(2,3-dihydroxybenzoyl)adenylate synthase n=1 Tax=Streptomyces sp. NBC_00820 TaxID=2975842 RepID=UPI002ED304E6|nr:AMP-binding protein [Streptomyces sp. NBC_00820]
MKFSADTLDSVLHERARLHPDRPALVSPAGDVVTYDELRILAEQLTSQLRRIGVTAGDRIVVQLPNLMEFTLLIFALVRMRAIPVLALPAHRKNEVSHLCRMTDAVGYVIPDRHMGFEFSELADSVRAENPNLRHVLIATGGNRPWHSLDETFLLRDGTPLSEAAGNWPDNASEAPGSSRPDGAETALLLLSGGTTGLPKLIARTHRDYAYNIRHSAAVCGLDQDSVYLTALPAAHNFALGCPGVLGTLAAGGKVVLAEDATPARTFPLIERERVTVTALTPPLLKLWLDEAAWTEHDLSSLALLQVGGARLSRADAERVGPELGCRLQQVFGMAEGLLCFTRADDPEDIVLSTQGRPLSGDDELRVVDGDEREVAPGEVGHLLVRGPYTVRGYYRAPEYDAIAFTSDGFYRTGDLVRITPTGHVIVEGRIKDVINRGGEKVPATEVESHLAEHTRVAEVAVVGMPDPLLGERTCTYVVPRAEPPTLRELNGFLRERGLAAHKLPDRLEIVATLPRTGAGKVDKRELAEDVAARLCAERDARRRTAASL